MTKKVNKKNAIVVVLVLLIVGLIYWAYASRPKVEETQVYSDLDYLETRTSDENKTMLKVVTSPYEACKDAHAIAILTEWDEFKDYNWEEIYQNMQKPAFIFDGRNVLDKNKLEKIGFKYQAIGS